MNLQPTVDPIPQKHINVDLYENREAWPHPYSQEKTIPPVEEPYSSTVRGDGTTLSHDAPCTLAQVMTFLWRAAQERRKQLQTRPFSHADTCTRGQTMAFLYRHFVK